MKKSTQKNGFQGNPLMMIQSTHIQFLHRKTVTSHITNAPTNIVNQNVRQIVYFKYKHDFDLIMVLLRSMIYFYPRQIERINGKNHRRFAIFCVFCLLYIYLLWAFCVSGVFFLHFPCSSCRFSLFSIYFELPPICHTYFNILYNFTPH